MKPTLFVGSSLESVSVAYAAQENLNDVAEVIVWTQGIFEISKFSLESLLDALDDTEFGLFVFSPDDVTRIRGAEMQTVRDNVIFELGLFTGRLGRKRCFIILPEGTPDLHLPTNLLGINLATYQPPRKPERLQAALGPACNKIRIAIQKDGSLQPDPSEKEEDDIKRIVLLCLSEHERRHLLNLAQGNTKGYVGRGTLRAELRHLRLMRLLENIKGRRIGFMRTGIEFNLGDYVELTDFGKRCIKLIK